MGWFPTNLDSEESKWRFDILILLAVIGSSATQKHIPAITASRFGLFPRLLPAPETLLDTNRAYRLPSVKGVTIIGIYSGIVLDELNYFANILTHVENVQPYEFRAYTIEYTNEVDAEKNEKTCMIPIKPFSLLDTVTILSILMTVGLLVMAGVINDGVALVGVGTMALSTCTASFSAWWRPKLVKRQVKSKVPGGSIVIKTRGGGFIVVKGDESVIRELYTGMDACDYIIKDVKRQWLLAASTLFLMISVIMFSNSSQRMQIAIGAAYFILNILYWLLALLVPPHNIWDMSRYRVQREEYEFHGNTLTDALWVAIQYTGQTEWVTRSHIMPNTRFWNQWLQEAQEALDKNPRAWDAGEGRNKLMNEAKEECERMPMPASKIFQDREDENEDEEDRSRPAKMKGGEVLLDGRK